MKKSYRDIVSYVLFIGTTLCYYFSYSTILKLLLNTSIKEVYTHLGKFLLWANAFILHSVGFLNFTITEDKIIFLDVNRFISIGPGCSGFKQSLLIICVMSVLMISWKRKILLILNSILILQLYNLIRIFLLSLIMIYLPDIWKFSHDYVFRPGYYLVIFYLWEFHGRKNSLGFQKLLALN
ncbi:MAG: archaeosortase/exosortase family protein [Bacteroidales bacterium]